MTLTIFVTAQLYVILVGSQRTLQLLTSLCPLFFHSWRVLRVGFATFTSVLYLLLPCCVLCPHWGSEAPPPHLIFQSIAIPDDFYLPNVLKSVSLTDTTLIQAIIS